MVIRTIIKKHNVISFLDSKSQFVIVLIASKAHSHKAIGGVKVNFYPLNSHKQMKAYIIVIPPRSWPIHTEPLQKRILNFPFMSYVATYQ